MIIVWVGIFLDMDMKGLSCAFKCSHHSFVISVIIPVVKGKVLNTKTTNPTFCPSNNLHNLHATRPTNIK